MLPLDIAVGASPVGVQIEICPVSRETERCCTSSQNVLRAGLGARQAISGLMAGVFGPLQRHLGADQNQVRPVLHALPRPPPRPEEGHNGDPQDEAARRSRASALRGRDGDNSDRPKRLSSSRRVGGPPTLRKGADPGQKVQDTQGGDVRPRDDIQKISHREQRAPRDGESGAVDQG